MVYPCLCLRYAPALRQLRQVAFLVTFPPTIPARLAARLLEVMFVCVFSKRVGEVSLVLYPASFYISFMSWASSYFVNGLNGGCWCPLVCWHPSLLLTCKKDTCVVLRSHPRHFLIFFTSNTELTQTLPFFFRYQGKSQLTLTWQLSPLYAWRLITISDRVWILCRYGPGTIAFKKCN